MTLRVLIVDDEELARLRLRSLVHECEEPGAQVVGEAANAVQALSWLAQERCDLVLLDVQMPGADGLRLASELRRHEQPPAVVFVTAHPEHAVSAFDLEAVDYLTKPVRRERLQAALHRAHDRLRARGAAADAEPVLVVNDRGRVTRVPVSEVLYLKAELKYVTLRTARHTYVLDESLSELEERLGERFLRVHRNALVARRAVRALERRAVPGDEEAGREGWAVRIEGTDEWLAVSRRQVAAVREALTAEGV
ncbi:LytR/AlgR family response regulator transcription factor [Caldimonas aquatica]|uniref:LytTR family DNA-binding domain-containing protein n=1 Tax=Caldimonas aquatica TaxID=376175 RepID=A0ABY6MV28_9BURK|nr:LytTR family DNA-binding domain-containing protein [Schlegelella aquatica]UZD55839.1 LytTR family DNA-binding domain-containing protein [Schlegelella aquatica]